MMNSSTDFGSFFGILILKNYSKTSTEWLIFQKNEKDVAFYNQIIHINNNYTDQIVRGNTLNRWKEPPPSFLLFGLSETFLYSLVNINNEVLLLLMKKDFFIVCGIIVKYPNGK